MEPYILEVENLTAAFGSREVLSGIGCKIRRGRKTAVVKNPLSNFGRTAHSSHLSHLDISCLPAHFWIGSFPSRVLS